MTQFRTNRQTIIFLRVLSFLGIIAVLYGVQSFSKSLKLKQEWMAVDAQVLNIERKSGRGGTKHRSPSHYRATLTYIVDEKPFTQSIVYTPFPIETPPQVGANLRVLVNPENPEVLQIDSFSQLWALPGIAVFLGILFFAVPVILRPRNS